MRTARQACTHAPAFGNGKAVLDGAERASIHGKANADASSVAWVLMLALALAPAHALAQGTAFSYQGRLASNNRPANGSFDLEFSLFNQPSEGARIGAVLSFPATPVTNGLFHLSLDFGQGAFDGSDRWVEIAVRTHGTGPLTTLVPRRPVLASPQAHFAATAASAQSVPASGITGVLGLGNLPALAADGSLLTHLNASALGVGTVPDARLSANVPRLDASQSFAGSQRFNGPLVALHPSNQLGGTLQGDGSLLAPLHAGAIVGILPSATHFTGPLAGDVTGSQGASVVSTIHLMSAARVARGASNALEATPLFQCDVIIRRDPGDGGFDAGPIRAASFTGDGAGLTNLPTSPNMYGAPRGALLASTQGADPALIAAGYQRMMTIPAPGWTAGATLNAPSARFRHTGVWDGQRFIVWGGLIGAGTPTGTGAWYDPATDAWTTVSTLGAPAGRSEHTAVWTGTQMVVWGGLGASSRLGTGARFTPGTQAWSATATAGAPSARQGHVAAWTGSRMVVWGGLDGSGLLNDGGVYNPADDTWVALPTANAPEPRKDATAVWSGSALYVWGGTGESGELSTGGILSFSGGAATGWTALPTWNAPMARVGHTAVWARDRMIVWGGTSGGVPLGDGGAYCLDCGDWTTVSMENAPLARGGHAAVWTGSEMLVVGGANAAGDVSSPAAYDPLTREWRPLSGLGGPMARTGPVAVWTTTDFLVFGGTSGGASVGTLQRLFPQPEWYFYRKL